MKIFDLKTNRQIRPIGIDRHNLCFSFLASENDTFTAELCLPDGTPVSSKKLNLSQSHCFEFDTDFLPATEYGFRVKSTDGTIAETRFETGADFDSRFITPADKAITSPLFKKNFFITRPYKSARLYITGLGLFRAYVNGIRVGRDYLTPGFNDYDAYLRQMTYDVTDLIKPGANEIAVELGDGWYRGRIGIDKPIDRGDKVFGEKYYLAAKLTAMFESEIETVAETDDSWECESSSCMASSIYDGEVRDYTAPAKKCAAVVSNVKYNVVSGIGVPIRELAVLKPTLIVSPKGEKILDFGQNMAGFVRFSAKLERGTKVKIRHGEVLQDGCFYSDNLRSAKAEAVYVSDGSERIYEPSFTYFGFKYALVEGLDTVNPDDFEGVVIGSDLPRTSECKTDNPKINKLIENTIWGQRGNFVDIPTDCPQRDERLGWTADTQVFSQTACFQEDCYPFYEKYMRDLRADQTRYYDGDIPMYSPSLKHEAGSGGAVWADCATILPWNMYIFYGDMRLLERSYPMMRDYVEVLISRDERSGARNLITRGFTFGDWLAQDGVCPQALSGGTDNAFIMSVYYYISVKIVAHTARFTGHIVDFERYSVKAQKIKSAILDEYFAPNGKLALDTQTAYVLSLYYGIYRNRERVITDFGDRLAKDFYRMKSGFTGTPLMLDAMFDAGMDDDAFRILLNEECPGWLYAVNLGATTVWERWNSLLPDGKISGTNMNSLNHYAYGSVCEAIYSRIAGLKCASAGWKSATIEPHPHNRMKSIDFSYDSPSGRYSVSWEITRGGMFRLRAVVPAGCKAKVKLPDGSCENICAGDFTFEVKAPEHLIHPFSLDTPNIDIIANPEAAAAMRDILPRAYAMVTGENEEFLIKNGHFLGSLPMFGTNEKTIAKYEAALKSIAP